MAKYYGCVLALLCLPSCTSIPGDERLPDPDERAAIDATVYEWFLHGMPTATNKRCSDEISHWRIVDFEPSGAVTACGYDGSVACFKYFHHDGKWPANLGRTLTPVAYIVDTLDFESRLYSMCHETLHWLAACAAESPDYDRTHQGPWFEAGKLTVNSLQNRAHRRTLLAIENNIGVWDVQLP